VPKSQSRICGKILEPESCNSKRPHEAPKARNQKYTENATKKGDSVINIPTTIRQEAPIILPIFVEPPQYHGPAYGAQSQAPTSSPMTNQLFLTAKDCDLQVVEPHNHRVNAAERAIQTFKDAFIVALAMTDSEFPLQLWDKLAPQIQNTLNLLRKARINPNILAYEALNGPYNWDRYPLAPPGGKPSFTKIWQNEARGRHAVPMHGIWGRPKTITDAIYIMSRKRAHIECQGLPSCFHSIVKSQTSVIQHI
jgi:hypothetical protein